MSVKYSIFSLGDQAIALEIAGEVIDPSVHTILVSMKDWIRKNSFEGFHDVVLGYRSIAITFDLFQLGSHVKIENASAFVKQKLEDAYRHAAGDQTRSESRHVRIPVCYSRKYGFDIENISNLNKISVDEIIHLHTAESYRVYLVGFLPGFPYLGFVDKLIEVPRHASPRTKVPAGSVGIAGRQTGIYPFDSPGGWQIIGRTPVKIFDPLIFPPIIAEVGDTVSFYSITEDEFDHFANSPL